MAHSRIYPTFYSHLAAYVPIALHKARYLAHSPNVMVPSRLCYNGTLVWLGLTNTPHACHFSVVYNLRITGVASIHQSVSRIFP